MKAHAFPFKTISFPITIYVQVFILLAILVVHLVYVSSYPHVSPVIKEQALAVTLTNPEQAEVTEVRVVHP